MEIYILASGSKANCCIVKTTQSTVMIDCGITKRKVNQFLTRDPDYLFVTHQHSDHVKYLDQFSSCKKYSVFESEKTTKLDFYKKYTRNDLTIMPLELSHDSDNTAGYIFQSDGFKLVYITDTGYISEKNIKLTSNADYYIIESNHDTAMLMKTKRPQFLKKRILGTTGHLSNIDAAIYLTNVIGDKTKEIILAHLSSEANSEELAKNTLVEILEEYKIKYKGIIIGIAKQDKLYKGGK